MSESQEQAYQRKQIKLADEELAHRLMAGTHEFHDPYPDNQIAYAKELYVAGTIELDEFEQRCNEALGYASIPCSSTKKGEAPWLQS